MRPITPGATSARVHTAIVKRSVAPGGSLLALLAGSAFGVFDLPALGAPTGEQVVSGQASFVRNGNLTTITASNNAIINYRSFDIGSAEAVRFIQPSSSSRVLNRIQGESPTRIDGTLTANGRVYIVNPAGVMFGAGSIVNAAGIYAAAGRLSDADFLAGKDHFTSLAGTVIAEGLISARDVTIVARRIENHGRIVADGGLVTAVIGSDVYVREEGSRVYVRVDGRDLDPSQGPAPGSPGAVAGPKGDAGIRNTGTIAAKGGLVTLGAGDTLSLAIHNTGVISAGGGGVHLLSSTGTVRNDGLIDVSVPAGKAGEAILQAPIVAVAGHIDASSGAGQAGRIEALSSVGTVIAPGAYLNASGGAGFASGGTVHVNSTGGDTFFSSGATINISGGKGGGDGGFAEVSAKNRLAVQGEIIGYAGPGYAAAVVLLDPTHIVIAASGPDNAQLADGTILGSDAGSIFTVSPAAIQAFLGDVRLEAVLDIAVQASITKTNGGLTLIAGRDIRFMGMVGNVGGAYRVGGCSPASLSITANFLDFRAGHSIQDFAGNGGAQLTARQSFITLVGATGSVQYGKLSVPRDQLITIRQADNMVLDSQRIRDTRFTRLVVESTNGTLLIENPCSDVQEWISLWATSRNGTTVQDRLVTSEDMHLLSDGYIAVNSHLKAQTVLEVHSGRDGSGNLTFGRAGLQLWGTDITLAAGNGSAANARVDVRSNPPFILGPTGYGSRPTRFAFRQDAPITDANLPALAQFGTPLEGMYYFIESMGASVTLANPPQVNRTRLTLASRTGTTINAPLNLITLDVIGPVVLTGNVSTDFYQTYFGPARISGDRDLNATTVTFGSTLDSFGDGADDSLAIHANLLALGPIGGTSPFRDLSVDGAAALAGGLVRTLNTQAFGGPVVLATSTTFESTNRSTITFQGTLDGTPGGDREAVTILGDLVANGPIGSIDPLAFFSVSGHAILCADSVTTAGGQYYGDVTLCSDTTLTSTSGDVIVFNGRVDGTPGGEPEALVINGQAFFGDLVGSIDPLASLVVNGPATIYGELIRTVDLQTYNGPLTIAKVDTTLEATSGGPITFNGPVDAEAGGPPERLTVIGTMIANAAIGAIEPLGTLTVHGPSFLNGGSVTTVGDQSYAGPVLLGVDTTLTGETIRFGSTVDGTPGGENEALAIHGNLVAEGPIGSVTPLESLDVSGASELCGGSVTTLLGQSYGGDVILCTNTVLASLSNANITFQASVNGDGEGDPEALTIRGGLVAFGPIGDLDPLASLTVHGPAELNGGSVFTVGEQRYAGAVVLGADTTLTGTTVRFEDALNGTPGGEPEALTIHGNLVAHGPIGNLDPLASLTVNGGATLAGGLVATVLGQDYNGPVSLAGDITLRSTEGTIAFADAVDSADPESPASLTIEGNLDADGPIGANAPLQFLAVSGDAMICGGSVTTIGSQFYGGDVVLCRDTVLTSTSGSTITFDELVDGTDAGEQALTVNGHLVANGAVGSLVPLESLMVAGPSDINGGLVRTFGAQRYHGAVVLGNDATFKTLSAGTIRFDSTIDSATDDEGGAPRDLTIVTTPVRGEGGTTRGLIIFNGSLGATGRLRDVYLCTDGDRELVGLPPTAADVPTAATIVALRSTDIHARDFEACAFEKFTTLGSLLIEASRSATFGDLVTQGDMTVTSPSIVLQKRPAANLIKAPDGSLTMDRGLDFVAGGEIRFSGTVSTTGAGSNPTFSSGSGARPASLAAFEFTKTDPARVSDAALVLDGKVLDQKTLAANVPQDDVKADLAGATKAPRFTDSVQPRVFDLRLMARVAIDGRGPSRDEALNAIRGRYIYNDLPTSVAGYEAGERTFVATRLNPASVHAAVDRFNELFGPPWQDRTPRVATALVDAANRYRAAGGPASGTPFRAYLEQTPSEAEALGYVRQLQGLVAQLRALGLPSAEFERSRYRLLSELSQLTSMTPEQLLAICEDKGMVLSSL